MKPVRMPPSKLLTSLVPVAPLAMTAWALACGGSQPPPQCTVGRGGNAVRYTLVEGSGACAQKTGEIVGAQSYRVPGSGNPPTLSLQPNTLLSLKGQDPDTSHLTWSTGTYTTDYPEADSFCTVPSTSEARQVVGSSGTDVRYVWNNVRIYDSTAIPGTQWTADLTYSEGSCVAKYKAVGLFPAISCAVLSGGKPQTDPNTGKLVVNPALCKSRVLGLSIDPHFPVTCDDNSGLCVLAGDPPQATP